MPDNFLDLVIQNMNQSVGSALPQATANPEPPKIGGGAGLGVPSNYPGGEPLPKKSFKEAFAPTKSLLEHEPNLQEEQDLASSVGQDKLGPPGLRNPLARADLSFSVDNSEEGVKNKIAKFKSYYPNGDLKYVPKYGQYLYRTDPSQPYAKLDPEILQNKGEPGIDTAAGLAYPGLVTGAMMAAPEGILPTIAAGAGAGALRQGEEAMRGLNPHFTDKENSMPAAFGGAAKDVAEEAAGGAVGFAATRVPEALRNLNKGEGLLKSQPSRAQLRQDIDANGNLVPLTAGQETMYPNIRRLQQFSETGESKSIMAPYKMSQQKSALDELSKLHQDAMNQLDYAGLTNPVQPLPVALEGSIEAYRRRLLGQLPGYGRLTSDQLGQDIQKGIGDFQDTVRKEHSLLYGELYNKFQPTFDLSSVKKLANDIAEGPQLKQLPPKPKLDSSGNPIIGNDGTPVMEESPDSIDRLTSPDLKHILRLLKNADPVMRPTSTPSGDSTSPIQQLLKLRNELWDIKNPRPGDLTPRNANEVRYANMLYSAITDTIENPKLLPPALQTPVKARSRTMPGITTSLTPDQLQELPGGDEFVKQWQRVNGIAKNNYNTLDSFGVVQAARTGDTAKLGDQVADPKFSFTALQNLQRVLPPQTWQNIQRQFENYMLSSKGLPDDLTGKPSRILYTMEKDSPEKLNLLIPDFDRRQALREVADQFYAFKKAGIEGNLDRETENSQLVERLLKNRDTNSVQQLENLLPRTAVGKPDLDSNEGRMIREGILDNLKNATTERNRLGETQINSDKFEAFMQDLRHSTADRFLKPTDRDLLNLIGRYTHAIKGAGDIGVSQQAAERESGILGSVLKGEPHKALGPLLEMFYILPFSSRVMTSKYANDVLYGSLNRQGMSNTYLHKLAAVMGNVYRNDIAKPGDKQQPQDIGSQIDTAKSDYSGFRQP